MLMVFGSSLASATLALVFGVLAFITVLLISGQPLDASNVALLAASVAVTVLAILTIGYLLSPLSVLRRGVGGFFDVFVQMGTVFGGILFPVALLPAGLQYISKILPSSWAMKGIAASIRGGEATGDTVENLLIAVGLAMLCGALSFLMFRRVEEHVRVTGTIDAA